MHCPEVAGGKTHDLRHVREAQGNHVDKCLGCWLATGAKIFHNQIFHYHICILLVNMNWIIYIYYIIYEGNAQVCMLTVRDDKLFVGNSALCRACRRWWLHMREIEESREWVNQRTGSGIQVSLGNRVKKRHNCVFLLLYLHSTNGYESNDIYII